ncbi:putative LIM domain-containing serine/threonine-protein kinase [Phytophthora citrophthora]|uniref:LIM domain-containing serine/threonine-protein kinase n=1 Tax=Phytophthora citrophthora TaxID=4793 RepID=A0AAD9GQP1_9STRA|nr:putative LIM domain-containing serine/threonine-protein kinase [Phytophthora citrophthora]
MEFYNDGYCDDLSSALAFIGDRECHAIPDVLVNYASAIATVDADLTIKVQFFGDNSCQSINYSDIYTVDLSIANLTQCVSLPRSGMRYNFFSNYSSSGSSEGISSSRGNNSGDPVTNTLSSSVGAAAIIGIAAVAVVVVVVIVFFLFRKKRADRTINSPSPAAGGRGNKNSYAQDLLGQHTTASTDITAGSRPSHKAAESLWNDEVIIAAKIPREKVLMHEQISRGGFGEVYVGAYNGRKVAIKMLLPEIRKRIHSVNEFLTEVKLMASLEHPRIVEFIGVAWDSLTDLCVVSELMEGGYLRALLNQFENEKHSHGFDHDKVKIALHVAHALTYMHSFAPPIVHRDLKSKNILLTNEFDAKLTDFGSSRERVDRTMTAGVGTSLWMAPEIMAGEKYDEKVDMFSFAIVLSELDSHVLPYTNLRQETRTSDVAILQLVMQGKIQIEFSEACPSSISALGMACSAKDPTARPTAVQALYELQQALYELQQALTSIDMF